MAVFVQTRSSMIEPAAAHLVYQDLYDEVVRAVTVVYSALGPGLSEVVYQNALCLELTPPVERERVLPVFFKGSYVGTVRPDLVLDGSVVIEIKAVAKLSESHQAQARAYLRWMPPALEVDGEATQIFGIVVNFGPNSVEMLPVDLHASGAQK